MSNILDIVFKLFLLIFGAAIVIGGLLLLWGVYRTRKRIKDSQSWPETTGTVTSAEIKTQHHRSGDNYIPDIKYAYSVLGANFTGKFLLDNQRTNDDALELIAPFQVGCAIPVRYNPENLQEHVTEQDLITTRLYLVVVGMLMFGVMSIWLGFII